MERGKIKYPKRARQKPEWGEIGLRNASPTDIDGFVEFANRLFIFFEYKYKGDSPFNHGQKEALERVCRCCSTGGKESYIILATHNEIIRMDYKADEAIVESVYIGKDGEWSEKAKGYPVIRVFRAMLARHNIK